jgi:hypothetical protein
MISVVLIFDTSFLLIPISNGRCRMGFGLSSDGGTGDAPEPTPGLRPNVPVLARAVGFGRDGP